MLLPTFLPLDSCPYYSTTFKAWFFLSELKKNTKLEAWLEGKPFLVISFVFLLSLEAVLAFSAMGTSLISGLSSMIFSLGKEI